LARLSLALRVSLGDASFDGRKPRIEIRDIFAIAGTEQSSNRSQSAAAGVAKWQTQGT
jgi:hypothetical protein